MKLKRNLKNPLIIPADVKPSNETLKVDGIFNCGVVKYNDEVIILCRVAESIKQSSKDIVYIPILDSENNYKIKVIEIDKNNCDKGYDFSDTRSVWKIKNGVKKIEYLTSISHLRIARSKDGVNFVLDDKPTIFPYGQDEVWGIEDPRITKIDDTYYINYTSVSPIGASTSLIITKDFKNFERKGVIFPPENKDVSIFSEKINGKYYAYHRPVPYAIGNPDMWISCSLDLIHWGEHKHLIGVSEDGWESGRIGGGAPSFKCDKGWIHIYHAADKDNRYCLGAFITSLSDPSKIIAKTKQPILEPECIYETEGFFNNVVFTCGAYVEDEIVNIYYGAADDKIAVASIELDELYKALNL